MSKNLYRTKKKWYESQLKSRQGEMIVILDDENYNVEIDKTDYDMMDKLWINENPRLFFKPKSNITSLFAELFSSVLYNKFGLKTIVQLPAVVVKKDYQQNQMIATEGVVSEDFVENRMKDNEITPSDFIRGGLSTYHSVDENVSSLYSLASQLKDDYFGIYEVRIDPSIKTDLQKLVVLDFLTHNTDRHKKNITYLLIKNGAGIQIKLAPIYDNGMSFELVGKKDMILESIRTGKQDYINEILSFSNSQKFTMKKQDYKTDSENATFKDAINKKLPTSIAEEISKNKSLKVMLKKVLKTKVSEIVEEIKQAVPEFEPNPEDVLIATHIFEAKKQQIVKELKMISLKNKQMKNKTANTVLPKTKHSENNLSF